MRFYGFGVIVGGFKGLERITKDAKGAAFESVPLTVSIVEETSNLGIAASEEPFKSSVSDLVAQ